MEAEKLILVDEEDIPVAVGDRATAIADNIWRRASGGIIVDRLNGLVLCHKRASIKDERPSLWVATFGGKVREGETEFEAAKRELYEEFGLEVDTVHAEIAGKYKSNTRKQHESVYIIDLNLKKANITEDKKEVEAFKILSIKDVVIKLENNNEWYSYGYDILILRKLSETGAML